MKKSGTLVVNQAAADADPHFVAPDLVAASAMRSAFHAPPFAPIACQKTLKPSS